MKMEFSFKPLINSARKYGVPVRVLEDVQQSNYTRLRGSESVTNQEAETIQLDEGPATLAETGLAQPGAISPTSNILPVQNDSELADLESVYHECTHAYFGIRQKANNVAVIQAVKAANAYYAGAPLTSGTPADAPRVLAQEAAAMYVGHRVAQYWTTYQRLAALVDQLAAAPVPDRVTLAAEALRVISKEYEVQMKRRDFGYQFSPYFELVKSPRTSYSLFSESTSKLRFAFHEKWKAQTSVSIEAQLKKVCDEGILETKLDDALATTSGFLKLLSRLPHSVVDANARGGA